MDAVDSSRWWWWWCYGLRQGLTTSFTVFRLMHPKKKKNPPPSFLCQRRTSALTFAPHPPCFSITSGQTRQNSAGMWTVTRIILRTLKKKREKRIKMKSLLRLLEENVCSLIPAVLCRRYNLTSAIRAARCLCSHLPWWKTLRGVKVGSSLLACLGLVYTNVGGGWGRSSLTDGHVFQIAVIAG